MKHQTELAYTGRAPFESAAHVAQHLLSSVSPDADDDVIYVQYDSSTPLRFSAPA